MVPLDFYWNKSNLNTPWELNTCVYMWVIYCDSIRMILQILYPSTVWGYNAWYLSRAHRCLLAPLSSIPQRSPWTERSWWDLWHDVQKPCYFIMAAPRISKKRPVHHRGSYLKKHKNSEMDGTKEEVLSSFDKEEEFRWQIRRWPHRSIWQSHTTCPCNLGHLPSQQDAPPSPYSATSHSSRTLKKKRSKEKHQFLKYPMNAFTLSGKTVLSPLKDDIWSKKCIYMIRKGPERLLITEMTELHNITVESRKKHVYALYLLAGMDPSELSRNKDAIL